jgi:hypothetical protein
MSPARKGETVQVTRSKSRVPGGVAAASAVLLVKSALGLWGAYALLSASRAHHRSFLGGTIRTRNVSLGIALGALAVASLVVALELLRMAPWARLAAFVLEGVGSALALARVASRPASSLTSLAMSAVIVGLLLMPQSAAAFARSPKLAHPQPHPTTP